MSGGRRALVVVLTAMVAILWAMSGGRGDTGTDSSERVSSAELGQRRDELVQLRQQLRAARQQAQALKGRETKVLAELETVDKQVNVLERYLGKLGEQETALGGRLSQLAVDIDTREAELEASRQRLKGRIRQMYKMGKPTLIEVVFASESLPDLFRRIDFEMRLADEETKLMDRIETARAELLEARREVEQRRYEVQLIREEKDSERNALVALQAERKSRLASIKNERKAREAAIVELAEAQKRLEELIKRLEAVVLAGEDFVPVSGPFVEAKGRLPWPVRGSIADGFGLKRNPNGTETRNNGIDIRARSGQPIRAVADGQVIFRDWLTGYGNCILVNHGGGYYTFYAHASDMMVDVNQTVRSGDVIATVGETGSLEGPMLHFEVRRGSTALDPRGWLHP